MIRFFSKLDDILLTGFQKVSDTLYDWISLNHWYLASFFLNLYLAGELFIWSWFVLYDTHENLFENIVTAILGAGLATYAYVYLRRRLVYHQRHKSSPNSLCVTEKGLRIQLLIQETLVITLWQFTTSGIVSYFPMVFLCAICHTYFKAAIDPPPKERRVLRTAKAFR